MAPTTEEMLAAINLRSQQMTETRAEELRGPAGPRGPQGLPGKDAAPARDGKDGRDGRDGKDAQPVEIIVGDVSVGDKAAAIFTRRDGVYVLNLVLPRAERGPRGERGEPSQVPGPQGIPGRDGADSQIAGPPGRDGADSQVAGPVGPKGDAGLCEDEIRRIVVSALSDVGVMNENAKKLIEVKALIRRKLHECNARHMSEFSSLVKAVDKIIS